MFGVAKFSVKTSVKSFLLNGVRSYLQIIAAKQIHFFKDKHPPKRIDLVPKAQYGGEHMVTLLTGATKIGRQGASLIRTLFDSAKIPISFEHIALGTHFEYKPEDFVNSVKRNRSALHIDIQYKPEQKQETLLLNSDLDLYACVIKMRSFEGYRCRFPDADITVIIQNNMGDYAKLEYEAVPGIVETLKIIEVPYIERYIRFVFKYAKQHCRKKITFGHKEAELPRTDGMFLDIAYRVHKEYPDVEIEVMNIDKLILALIMNPNSFDVICTGDRYGTIVASICSAICGGASLFSAMEIGDHHAVFKPLQTKLSITDICMLSPYGIVSACVDLLNHLGNHECAHALWNELLTTMLDRNIKTQEFGGTDSSEFVIGDIVNRFKCRAH